MLYSTYYIKKCIQINDDIDYNFVDWINKVERIVNNKIGFLLLDLPDENYMMNYTNKSSYINMAKHIIHQYKNII